MPSNVDITELEQRLESAPLGVATSAARLDARPRGPLRVLMVVESCGGGTGRHVLDLSEGLLARGCEVHLLYATGRMDLLFSGRLRAMPSLHRVVIPMRTAIHPSDIAAAWAVRGYLRRHGPFDVIHGHSSKGGAIARLAALFTKTPVIYTMHGLTVADPKLPAWKRHLYGIIERALSVATERIIAVSPEEGRAATALKLGADRVIVIPNGVGNLQAAPRSQARQALQVPDEAIVIGFIGRLVLQKAPEILLEAFAIAAASAPRAYLAMVGSGPMREQMHDLGRRLAIADKVRWLDERNACDLLTGFDVFALASRKEGMPYVVLEAMSAGLPVVATDRAGVESLIYNGVHGFVVPPDDPHAFAAALIKLLEEPALRAACGHASAEHVGGFTIDRMVDETLTVYCAARTSRTT